MTTEKLIFAILSSSLLSGIFGAFIAGQYSLRAKRNDYVNDYYKLVLSKRVLAYEKIEVLISSLKTSVLDHDNRPHHQIFTSEAPWPSVFALLLEATSQSLWLSDDVFDAARELNYLLFRGCRHKDGAVAFAKESYAAIAELREKIERIHHADMLSLHDVKGFLAKKKNINRGFNDVHLNG